MARPLRRVSCVVPDRRPRQAMGGGEQACPRCSTPWGVSGGELRVRRERLGVAPVAGSCCLRIYWAEARRRTSRTNSMSQQQHHYQQQRRRPRSWPIPFLFFPRPAGKFRWAQGLEKGRAASERQQTRERERSWPPLVPLWCHHGTMLLPEVPRGDAASSTTRPPSDSTTATAQRRGRTVHLTCIDAPSLPSPPFPPGALACERPEARARCRSNYVAESRTTMDDAATWADERGDLVADI
jgi:hypothetical protein